MNRRCPSELCRFLADVPVSEQSQSFFETPSYRLIWAQEPGYPCWLRLIAREHVREMTHLDAESRMAIFQALCVVEQVVLEQLEPVKLNWASFGNMVPHLHWHMIPRFVDDRHFPSPSWGEPRRQDSLPLLAWQESRKQSLQQQLIETLSGNV